MASKINIGVFLSLGHVFNPFFVGTLLSSLGWFILGIRNKSKIWIINGFLSLISSIYINFFAIHLLINNSLIPLIQRIISESAYTLIINGLDNPFLYFVFLFVLLQIISLIFFCIEFNTYLIKVSLFFIFLSIILLFYTNNLLNAGISWMIANSIAAIGIASIPEEVLEGFVSKPKIELV